MYHVENNVVILIFIVYLLYLPGAPVTVMSSEVNMLHGCVTPPSYDDAMSTQSAPGRSSSSSHLPDMTNAELLCRIDAGQIYFITPEGYVSAPSYPSCLSIYLLTDRPEHAASATNCETPPAFLQVGDWVYPLLPGQSPVLQSNWGSYIFPDVSMSIPGTVLCCLFAVTGNFILRVLAAVAVSSDIT